ncbi:hypothetical protein [Chlorobium ferrooxidans]|uniref:Uncharacterized protein n=1 Tax=Chlorobium ferrooxidans DSM 13031 TaxID=377431 RepID=Q0YQR9_9CHLB|nr:hypothetical protein [Chlorobium ferrooxidans]EAT58674.1 hypothetical protein CferDRAFT_0648 [Chlorobium ferrooxidans DSM 13031]
MSQITAIQASLKGTGVICTGLERKSARIRNGIGSTIADVLGWDVIVRGEDGSCYGYYAAQPPLIGLTQPQPVTCPLGIVPFDGYKIDIDEAIKIFHSQNGGDQFTAITLSWPLTYPEAPEPYWHFRTNLGDTVVIGANSGQCLGHPSYRLLYGTPPVPLYQAPSK